MSIDQVTIYPAPYHGPTQEDIDAANAVIRQRAMALSDQQKRSALQCVTCNEINVVSKWTKIEVYETCFGPYDRSTVLSHRLLKCPDCGAEHQLGWLTQSLDKLMAHMKTETRNDD